MTLGEFHRNQTNTFKQPNYNDKSIEIKIVYRANSKKKNCPKTSNFHEPQQNEVLLVLKMTSDFFVM